MLKEQINPALPSEAPEVPCLFCVKNPRRSPDSDFCQPCWDEWKRTGIKPKAVIHGDGTPIQPAPTPAPIPIRQEAEGTAAARKAALLEQDEPLTEADIAAMQLRSMQRNNPMLTMADGTKRVACTQCHQRPLKFARLCQECYDERMRIADWRAKLDIVRRGTGKPKLTCPWCGNTEHGWIEGGLNDSCCGSMRIAMCEIYREEAEYRRAADHFEIPGGL